MKLPGSFFVRRPICGKACRLRFPAGKKENRSAGRGFAADFLLAYMILIGYYYIWSATLLLGKVMKKQIKGIKRCDPIFWLCCEALAELMFPVKR